MEKSKPALGGGWAVVVFCNAGAGAAATLLVVGKEG